MRVAWEAGVVGLIMVLMVLFYHHWGRRPPPTVSTAQLPHPTWPPYVPPLEVEHVVTHCGEPLGWTRALLGPGVHHVVMEKCAHRLRPGDLRAGLAVEDTLVQIPLAEWHARASTSAYEGYTRVVVTVPRDRGDECSGFLHYLTGRYARLPTVVATYQGFPHPHLLGDTLTAQTAVVRDTVQHLLDTPADRYASFGALHLRAQWDMCPHHCAGTCLEDTWTYLTGTALPRGRGGGFRFYANGMFAASRVGLQVYISPPARRAPPHDVRRTARTRSGTACCRWWTGA